MKNRVTTYSCEIYYLSNKIVEKFYFLLTIVHINQTLENWVSDDLWTIMIFVSL